jgi:hypothetical protein
VIASRVARIAIAALVGLGPVACGPAEPTPTGTSSATVVLPSASLSPPASASPIDVATNEPPPSLPPGITVDPGLLEVLPADIDGVVLEPDPVTAAQIGSDPLLSDSVRSIAVAVAVAPGDDASSPATDLAVASVIRLLPDVFDEAFYQEWRDTYNEAACEVADGVQLEGETEIAGRQVHGATCVGGARTYHTYLPDQGFIVSVTATGEHLFGERIMAGLAG